MIKAEYTWVCEKCGATERSDSTRYLQEQADKHQCNSRLYDLIRSISTEYKYKGVIINNNGAVYDVAKYMGITEHLAGEILDEMEEKGLAEYASWA
jgi:hypothetical protein